MRHWGALVRLCGLGMLQSGALQRHETGLCVATWHTSEALYESRGLAARGASDKPRRYTNPYVLIFF